MSRERRAALAVFPILIIGGVIDLAIEAARGRDLGGPTGILAGGVLSGIIAWFLTRSKDKPR